MICGMWIQLRHELKQSGGQYYKNVFMIKLIENLIDIFMIKKCYETDDNQIKYDF